jgi:hypothetical protein
MGQEIDKGQDAANQPGSRVARTDWLKKLGWVGFLLFLLKGIIWLVVGYLLLG